MPKQGKHKNKACTFMTWLNRKKNNNKEKNKNNPFSFGFYARSIHFTTRKIDKLLSKENEKYKQAFDGMSWVKYTHQ